MVGLMSGRSVLVLGVDLQIAPIISSLLVSVVLLIGAIVVRRGLQTRPGRLQISLEMVYGYLTSTIRESLPEIAWGATPVILTLFFYILLANLVGLLPYIESPTATISSTVGLALIVFSMMIYYGVKTKGVRGYLKSFLRPHFLFLPINIVETLTKPVTLAFRLFGNIFAGELLIVILVLLVPVVVPTAFSLFHIFIGLVQAYLFFMLAIAYVAVACEE